LIAVLMAVLQPNFEHCLKVSSLELLNSKMVGKHDTFKTKYVKHHHLEHLK